MGNLVDTVSDRGGCPGCSLFFTVMPLAIMGKRETKETKKKEEAKKKKELVCRFLVTGWCIYTYFSQAAAARKEKEKVKKVFIYFNTLLCFVNRPLLSLGGQEEERKP